MSELLFGIVVGLDEGKSRVRVQFPERDRVVSYWLPALKGKTLRDKEYWMPDLDEHVACLMDDNLEAGVVLGAIYSDADAVPVSSRDKYHVTFADGTVIEYDRAEHKLTADVQGDIEVKATGECTAEVQGTVIVKSASSITLKAPQIGMQGDTGGSTAGTFTGDFTMTGNLTVNGNIAATGTITDAGGNTNHHSHP